LRALDHVKPIGIPAMISLYDDLSQNNPLLGEMKRCVDEGEVMPNIPQMGRFWTSVAAALELANCGRCGPAAALERSRRLLPSLAQPRKHRKGIWVRPEPDALWSDGRDLTGKTVLQRCEHLEQINTPVAGIQIGSYIENRGKDLFTLAKENGLEGIIAKGKASICRPGKRSHD
jgi:hypothetical protein